MAKVTGSKAKLPTTTGKTRVTVFNMVTPVSRVQTGNNNLKPEEGKIIKWGKADDLPHEYLRLIADSGTASSCMRRKQKFIFADGFSDETVADLEVNETQTADALLQDMAGDAAVFSGVALRVRYVDGKIYAENLPLECIRKLDSGFFLYNPTLGTDKPDKKQNEILSAYSTREALIDEAAQNAEEMAEKGQLYYYFEKVKGAYDYPVPVYASAGSLADMENDAEIAFYDLDEVKSGFRLSAILTILGEFPDDVDENGNVIENADLAAIKEQVKGMTTRKDRAEAIKKVMLLSAPTKEQLPSLTPFNNAKALELLDSVTERVAHKVCRNWNVPPVLIGLSKAGQLGQTQEIANMIQLFQMDIVGTQNMIQRIFAELWPVNAQNAEIDWTISTLNPIQFIPDYVLGWLNQEQKQTIISRFI